MSRRQMHEYFVAAVARAADGDFRREQRPVAAARGDFRRHAHAAEGVARPGEPIEAGGDRTASAMLGHQRVDAQS